MADKTIAHEDAVKFIARSLNVTEEEANTMLWEAAAKGELTPLDANGDDLPSDYLKTHIHN